MFRRTLIALLAGLWTLAVGAPPSAHAGWSKDEAVELCEDRITDVYGLSRFRDVWAEKLGHRKYRVNGQVKYEGHKYPFNCKVKNGYVKSYYYSGPHSRDDDDKDLGAALAIGAGLAIVAAIAASADKGDKDVSKLKADREVLEDNCHDELVYRMRDEHRDLEYVRLESSSVKGTKMTGKGRVRWDHHSPGSFNYSCYFNSHGEVTDSNYLYY